jgi:O-antigen ligase
MFSYSRASLLNVLAAFAVLLFLERARIRLRRVAIFVLACIVAGATAYALLPAFANIYWQRLSLSFQYVFSATGAVLSGRLDSWRVLVDFLLEHPWHALLGVGYKTLPYSTFIGQRVVADNMYISTLVETGLIGLASLALLSFAIFRAGWRACRSTDTNRSFFGAWILCFWAGQLVQMMSQDVLTYWRVLPVYFCVLALAVRQGDEHSLP